LLVRFFFSRYLYASLPIIQQQLGPGQRLQSRVIEAEPILLEALIGAERVCDGLSR
jgi:hypothetical protein